ncbi:hypothetical protein [uncultured Psychrobacter sp.]|uniref:hypothetical protein n=1 Tax=uncultured Psychrobacter sp. TaxID=259303 RepID=UPI00261A6C09|nr:hypothetical protein [uncultured Psychrobacter sp.]
MDALIKKLTMPLLITAASIILSTSAIAAVSQTYVIDTYGGDALLPAVRQQLNSSRDGGTVSSYQDKLVLQTSAANYKAVQQLLAQIDTQPQPLLVAVRVGSSDNIQSNIRQGQVIISKRGIQGTGIVNQSDSQQQSNSLYQVQTLSGSAASISTNTLYSLTQNYQAMAYRNNRYPPYHSPSAQIIIQQQVLLPTTRGIAVTPRLLPNNQVEVQLSQAEEKLLTSHSRYHQKNAIESQRLNSTVIVPRGQWVTIGQVTQNSQNQSSGFAGNSRSMTSTSAPIQLLVQ